MMINQNCIEDANFLALCLEITLRIDRISDLSKPA